VGIAGRQGFRQVRRQVRGGCGPIAVLAPQSQRVAPRCRARSRTAPRLRCCARLATYRVAENVPVREPLLATCCRQPPHPQTNACLQDAPCRRTYGAATGSYGRRSGIVVSAPSSRGLRSPRIRIHSSVGIKDKTKALPVYAKEQLSLAQWKVLRLDRLQKIDSDAMPGPSFISAVFLQIAIADKDAKARVGVHHGFESPPLPTSLRRSSSLDPFHSLHPFVLCDTRERLLHARDRTPKASFLTLEGTKITPACGRLAVSPTTRRIVSKHRQTTVELACRWLSLLDPGSSTNILMVSEPSVKLDCARSSLVALSWSMAVAIRRVYPCPILRDMSIELSLVQETRLHQSSRCTNPFGTRPVAGCSKSIRADSDG